MQEEPCGLKVAKEKETRTNQIGLKGKIEFSTKSGAFSCLCSRLRVFSSHYLARSGEKINPCGSHSKFSLSLFSLLIQTGDFVIFLPFSPPPKSFLSFSTLPNKVLVHKRIYIRVPNTLLLLYVTFVAYLT